MGVKVGAGVGAGVGGILSSSLVPFNGKGTGLAGGSLSSSFGGVFGGSRGDDVLALPPGNETLGPLPLSFLAVTSWWGSKVGNKRVCQVVGQIINLSVVIICTC